MRLTLGPGIGDGASQLLPMLGPCLLAAALLSAATYLAVRAVRAVRRRILHAAVAAALGTSGIGTTLASLLTALAPHQ